MILENFTYKYMKENYDYLYLKSQFAKTDSIKYFITGSSHGLLGIDLFEMGIERTINVSMHSQDLYYSLQSLKHFLEFEKGTKTFMLILGYYIPFQDLSRAGNRAYSIIRDVFYPLYKESHHLVFEMNSFDESLWINMPEDSYKYKKKIEESAMGLIGIRKQYVNDLYARKPYFPFEKAWRLLSDEEKNKYGKVRAVQHNRHFKYKESFEENKIYIQDMKKRISSIGGKMIIIIPPFTKSYYSNLDERMINEARNLYAQNSDLFIDYNSQNIEGFFSDEDFVDTDHLNGRGAYKLSRNIMEIIG